MKLLLIMPRFFDYPDVIKEELTAIGYEVDFFDDRPSTNGWIKAIIRFNKKLVRKYIRQYFNHMMNVVCQNQYDAVLLISGQSLSFDEEMILELKNAQPHAKFLLYQWDSLKNFPYIQSMHKFFDKRYSFDKKDVEMNDDLKFLPLFYSKRYEKIGDYQCDDFLYDFCFVGTAHPKKYKFINMMSSQLKSVYPKQYLYFFFPSRIVYLYRKIRNKELRKSKYNEFHYSPLKEGDLDDIYSNSRCILDSAQEGQQGLTIRILEALGARKKIITTNNDVVNYDFYSSENIYVYEGEIDLDNDFFQQPYKEIDREIYEKYSLNNWLCEILSNT